MNYSSVITVPDEETMNAISSKTFEQLLIHSDIIQRIKNSGFDSPTAVQSSSIALGVLGKDLLVQAKHGAGKTLVYSILAANVLSDCHLNQQREPLVVILASTREACTHIKDILVKLIPDERSVCIFYGEDDFINNKNLIATGCTVAIGTPARMALLVKKGGISLKQSKLFVIDEADVLMPNSKDIKTVFNGLSEDIQVTAFTTTFSSELEKYLCEFMKSPAVVRIIPEGVQTLANQNPGNVAHGNSSDGKEVQVPSPINKSNVSDNALTKVDRVEPQSQATDDVSIAVKNSDYYSSNNVGMGSWRGSPFGSSRGNGGLPSRGSFGSSRGNGFNSVASSGYGAPISAETSDAFTSNRGGFGQSSTQENDKWSKAPTSSNFCPHPSGTLESSRGNGINQSSNSSYRGTFGSSRGIPSVGRGTFGSSRGNFQPAASGYGNSSFVGESSAAENQTSSGNLIPRTFGHSRGNSFGTTGRGGFTQSYTQNSSGFSSNRGNGYNQTSGRGGFGTPRNDIVDEDW